MIWLESGLYLVPWCGPPDLSCWNKSRKTLWESGLLSVALVLLSGIRSGKGQGTWYATTGEKVNADRRKGLEFPYERIGVGREKES